MRKFNLRFLSPGCDAVDALSQDWGGENNWLCPPVSMVVDVIKHAESCSAVGTLVLSEWPSAFFRPLLKPKISRFAPFIRDVRYLSRRPDLIIPGPGQKAYYRSFSLVVQGSV